MTEGPGQPVTLGRIVHYSNGSALHQPAIVVRVVRPWDAEASPGVVNLQVFLDGPGGCVYVENVPYSTDPHRATSWHWPERH